MSLNIIAETQVQVLVEDTITLFTPAIKVDEIKATVQNLRCHIIPEKVIFQGILHKQIFFVNGNNVVVHQGVDIPFSGFVDLVQAEPGLCCQLTPIIEFIDFQLLSPTSLREVTVISINVRLLDLPPLENIFCNSLQKNAVFLGVKDPFVARGKGIATK